MTDDLVGTTGTCPLQITSQDGTDTRLVMGDIVFIKVGGAPTHANLQ